MSYTHNKRSCFCWIKPQLVTQVWPICSWFIFSPHSHFSKVWCLNGILSFFFIKPHKFKDMIWQSQADTAFLPLSSFYVVYIARRWGVFFIFYVVNHILLWSYFLVNIYFWCSFDKAHYCGFVSLKLYCPTPHPVPLSFS